MPHLLRNDLLLKSLIFGVKKCQIAVRERRRAKRKAKKHPENDEFKTSHFEKCVDAEITINRARDSYYDKQLSSCKGDSKGTYKVINKLLDKEYGSNKFPNGEDIEVADKLKIFFDKKVKTIYSNIEKEIQNTSLNGQGTNDSTPIQNAKCRLDQFKEVSLSLSELETLIKSLPNKSSVLDVIPMWLFKNCLPELLPIIYYIVNESLRVGKFPTALKEASIRPGLKKPTLDVDELKNYRPISNLTYLSKKY